MMYLYLFLSLIALIYGADLMVRGAVNTAGRLGVPPLVIGLTIVAWGTSAPELVVSLRAGMSGDYGIALGNILGSNIANILLISGVGALFIVLRPRGRRIGANLWLMLGTTLALAIIILLGNLSRWTGAAFLCLQLGLIALAFKGREHENDVAIEDISLLNAALLTLGGIVCLIIGGVFLVPNAIAIAEAWHVPQSIIGLSLIAVGTSLPELAATLAAIPCIDPLPRRHLFETSGAEPAIQILLTKLAGAALDFGRVLPRVMRPSHAY